MDSSAVPAKLFWEWHGDGEPHKALLTTYHRYTEQGHVKPAANSVGRIHAWVNSGRENMHWLFLWLPESSRFT